MSFGQGGPPRGPGDGSPQGRQPYGQQQPHGRQGPATPDWEALATASEARGRKRRWALLGGGAVATVAVAALVATLVVRANSDDPKASGPIGGVSSSSALPEDTTAPAPSFSEVAPPPPPDPKEFVSSAEKDKAPLTAESLYPGRKLTVGDRVYAKGALHRTAECASGTQGALGQVLTKHGCEQLIRATYRRDGVAVTVGVATFRTAAVAAEVKEESSGNIASLAGEGVPTFCRTTVCRSTANAYGRYVYFTVGGFTNGDRVTKQDRAVFTTGDDVAEFTLRQIHRRGVAQASQAAATQ
ncbi:hypothetical protein G3I34_27985 [Streptomyces sp. SID8014]|uniref:hypothetical protein n=1 Tax=Streptomyces sp. SID8014 TaxID=2706097 RepID=UPI0013B8AC7E|nr:hypothetical protein [Streptomyces sp. SID8014]NEC16044.1 hypothetical protein [Streptomyces sp. SID8014]